MPTRVLLVDSEEIVREGIRCLLERDSKLQVVGEAGDGLSAVRLASEMLPDVALVDVVLPGLNGIDATREICARTPHPKVIGFSRHAEPQYVFEMLKAGAVGYVLKSGSSRELLQAIRLVKNGSSFLSPGITGVVLDGIVSDQGTKRSSALSQLTAREREVLQLLSEGRATREIAALLNIGVRTVETHRYHTMSKLNLHSVASLTRFALREGLTAID
ncbi:MAG TPA: response regulator transcription factor [Acidobacteriota bacterium]|nr:response regulator transcription factor [Acidobacteriota bacterium]